MACGPHLSETYVELQQLLEVYWPVSVPQKISPMVLKLLALGESIFPKGRLELHMVGDVVQAHYYPRNAIQLDSEAQAIYSGGHGRLNLRNFNSKDRGCKETVISKGRRP